MSKTAKTLWNVITSLIALIVVALAIMLYGVKLFGLIPLRVLSGSMEPQYKTGSMIYIKKAQPQDIKADEPITFYMSDGKTLATHRVVKVDTENNCFYTKGDANDIIDPQPVPFSKLIGKPVFSIPDLGYIASFISSSVGSVVAIITVGILIALFIISDSVGKSRKNNRR